MPEILITARDIYHVLGKFEGYYQLQRYPHGASTALPVMETDMRVRNGEYEMITEAQADHAVTRCLALI